MGTNWERFQRLSWSPCHGVINVPIKSSEKNYSPKNFTVWLWTKGKYWKLCSLIIKIVLQISDEILVLLIAALGFKWNTLWHWIFILDNYLSVHIQVILAGTLTGVQKVTFDGKFWRPSPQYNNLSWNWPNRRLQQEGVCSCYLFIEMESTFARFPTYVNASSLSEIVKIRNKRISN